MTDRARRAEEARQKILASGDPELINRLHLLDAASAAPARHPPRAPGLLGTGLAVAGGAWLGTVLAGLTLSGEMQAAFAAVADDLGLDPGLGALDAAALAEEDGFLDDFGLGDLFDV
ncbi:hypothetical protein [Rhodovulum strictum]|uniref:Uncharacterized protein n=1 Tax=Rhodovulum strictum TaxID=58314 RepID=A0A844BL19_9RHOB|nr:hypothetical protein [Rhodovulum strictum]MRH20687.1 hypothetical protein [Rhodovulum strictum]